jgi:prophage regulatory protein
MTTNLDGFLRLRTVLAITGLSRSTLYRRIQAGTFPRQVRIAERCVGWRQSAVDAWLCEPCAEQAASDVRSNSSAPVDDIGVP